MNLTRQPIHQKGAKKARKASVKDPAYMGRVKQLPCVICNAPPPSDAHHCTHKPYVDEHNPYEREPCAGRKSGDRDTIPLCKKHHQDGPEAIHNGKSRWREKHGPDFSYITNIRKLCG